MNIVNKIRLTLRACKEFLLKRKYFGCSIMLKLTFLQIMGIYLGDFFKRQRNELLKKYLSARYKDVLENKIIEKGQSKKIIWVFWWQGADTKPPICKACYNSLLEACPKDYEIVNLSKDNISDWIIIPSEIFEKVKKGIFSFTHLSDIIRTMLLAKHGGLWVDSTLYFGRKIPSSWFEYPFFSIKNKPDGETFISHNQWSTFIMGTNNKSDFFGKLSELMVEYGKRENCFIEYMTIDVFMAILFDMPKYKNLLDMVPVKNEGLHSLRPILNETCNEAYFKELRTKNVCFKLTYKMDFSSSVNGSPTYYSKILNYNEA